jgi:hypothetical protein
MGLDTGPKMKAQKHTKIPKSAANPFAKHHVNHGEDAARQSGGDQHTQGWMRAHPGAHSGHQLYIPRSHATYQEKHKEDSAAKQYAAHSLFQTSPASHGGPKC